VTTITDCACRRSDHTFLVRYFPPEMAEPGKTAWLYAEELAGRVLQGAEPVA